MRNLSFDFTPGQNRFMVLDVETQYLSEEVPGGWNAVDKLKVALVVTWDEAAGMRVWYEADVPGLLDETRNFSPIVTFNGERFDFQVLSAYGDVSHLRGERSRDLMVHLRDKLGFRVKLDSLAASTLGRGKSGSGIQSVEWWRSGDPALRQKVADYCRMDVELTRDIYLFGKEKGYVLLDDIKTGATRRINVSW
jgi:DEAD/DEAH box helicase domain-containing protein